MADFERERIEKDLARVGMDIARLETEHSRVVRPLAGELAGAFAYPFRPLTLIFSLAVALFAGAAGFLPFGGLIGAGIRFGWLFAVLRAASVGNDDVETDASNISASPFGWIGPAVRALVASFVAFLPAIVAAVWLGERGVLVAAALGLIGALYLPAALIVAAHDERWLAPANPGPAIALITRIPGSYFTAWRAASRFPSSARASNGSWASCRWSRRRACSAS